MKKRMTRKSILALCTTLIVALFVGLTGTLGESKTFNFSGGTDPNGLNNTTRTYKMQVGEVTTDIFFYHTQQIIWDPAPSRDVVGIMRYAPDNNNCGGLRKMY